MTLIICCFCNVCVCVFYTLSSKITRSISNRYHFQAQQITKVIESSFSIEKKKNKIEKANEGKLTFQRLNRNVICFNCNYRTGQLIHMKNVRKQNSNNNNIQYQVLLQFYVIIYRLYYLLTSVHKLLYEWRFLVCALPLCSSCNFFFILKFLFLDIIMQFFSLCIFQSACNSPLEGEHIELACVQGKKTLH